VGGRGHKILEPAAHSPVVLKWVSLKDVQSFGVADKARGKAILSKVPAVVPWSTTGSAYGIPIQHIIEGVCGISLVKIILCRRRDWTSSQT
jgi:hypothetical protein